MKLFAAKMSKPMFIFVAALIVRLVPALFVPLTGDSRNSLILAEAVLARQNPYQATSVSSNPPIWMWQLGFSLLLAKFLNLPFGLIYKIPLILADAGIALIIYRLLSRKDEKLALVAALFYAGNPVSILISAFQGQFESQPLLAILLAGYFLNPFFLSLAIGLKSYPVLLVPVLAFQSGKKVFSRIKFVFLATFPVFLLLLPFLLLDFEAVKKSLFSYSGMSDYGWGAIIKDIFWLKSGFAYLDFPFLTKLLFLSKIVFLALFGILTFFLIKKKTSWQFSVLMIFLLFITFYGGVSSQYLLWILPFLILVDFKKAVLYTIFALPTMLTYYGFFLPQVLTWLMPQFLINFIGGNKYLDPQFAAGLSGKILPLVGLPKIILSLNLFFNIIFWFFLIWLFFDLWRKKK